MAPDVNAFDLPAVARLLPHQHGNVDAARVVAFDQVVLAIAVADHAEEIAIFEGAQRIEIVHLLKAEDIGIRIGDGERRLLARIVRQRDGARLFQPLVLGLVADVEQAKHAILPGLVAKTGEVETGHQVFDVERGNAYRHEGPFEAARSLAAGTALKSGFMQDGTIWERE